MTVDLRAFAISMLLNTAVFLVSIYLLHYSQRSVFKYIDLSYLMLEEETAQQSNVVGSIQKQRPTTTPEDRQESPEHPTQGYIRENSIKSLTDRMSVPSDSTGLIKEETSKGHQTDVHRMESSSSGTSDSNPEHLPVSLSGKNQEKNQGSPETSEQEKLDYSSLFVSRNYGLIRDYINQHIKYPHIARYRGWEGRVVVSICLERDYLCGVHIKESSGYRVLDEAVIKAVHCSQRYFPYADEKVVLTLPVNFKLDRKEED